MRGVYPSGRWQKAFIAACADNGAWAGPATVQVLIREYGAPMYLRGATPSAAGFAAVIAYKLHRKVEDLQEAASV